MTEELEFHQTYIEDIQITKCGFIRTPEKLLHQKDLPRHSRTNLPVFFYKKRIYMFVPVYAKTFLPPTEVSKRVRFKDGDKTNLSIDNIEWNVKKKKKSNYNPAIKDVKAEKQRIYRAKKVKPKPISKFKAENSHYLSNTELLDEIRLCKLTGVLTRKAENMMMLLVDKVGKKFMYWSPDDRNDCRQTALLVLFSNWRGFDDKKGTNVFAYFSEIIKRGYARGLNELQQAETDGKTKVRFVPQKISIESSNDGEGISQFIS